MPPQVAAQTARHVSRHPPHLGRQRQPHGVADVHAVELPGALAVQHQPARGGGEERRRPRLDVVGEVELRFEEGQLGRRQQHPPAVDVLVDPQVGLPDPGRQARRLDHRPVPRQGRQLAIERRHQVGRGHPRRRPGEVDEVVVSEEGAVEESAIVERPAEDEQRYGGGDRHPRRPPPRRPRRRRRPPPSPCQPRRRPGEDERQPDQQVAVEDLRVAHPERRRHQQHRQVGRHQHQGEAAEGGPAPEQQRQTEQRRRPEDDGGEAVGGPGLQEEHLDGRFRARQARAALLGEERGERLPGGEQEGRQAGGEADAEESDRQQAPPRARPQRLRPGRPQERRPDDRPGAEVEPSRRRRRHHVADSGAPAPRPPPALEGHRGDEDEQHHRHVGAREAAVEDQTRRDRHQPCRRDPRLPPQPAPQRQRDHHQGEQPGDERRQPQVELGQRHAPAGQQLVERGQRDRVVGRQVGGEDRVEIELGHRARRVELVVEEELRAEPEETEEGADGDRREEPEVVPAQQRVPAARPVATRRRARSRAHRQGRDSTQALMPPTPIDSLPTGEEPTSTAWSKTKRRWTPPIIWLSSSSVSGVGCTRPAA